MPFGSRIRASMLSTPAPPARVGLAYRPYERDANGEQMQAPKAVYDANGVPHFVQDGAPSEAQQQPRVLATAGNGCVGCTMPLPTDQSTFRPMSMKEIMDRNAGRR